MRRVAMLAIVGSVLLVAFAGVAWAANVTCQGGPCVGTEQNDRITGSQLEDEIQALGGRDLVSARGGDDLVDGGRGGDDISGGIGGDALLGGRGPDDIYGGAGTPVGDPKFDFECTTTDPSTGTVVARIQGNQILFGSGGNDDLNGGIDNDLLEGDTGKNDLSGNGGDDCLSLSGDANERASGRGGDDLIGSDDGNRDYDFCGAGYDTVFADEKDRVAANCEVVIRASSLQKTRATPGLGVTITAPEASG